MKKNILEKNIEKKCAVCEKVYMTSELDLEPCPYCGWYNDSMCEEHEDEVIYRNLISFNKAKKLYTEGKPFTPSIEDFLDAFNFYGEMEFRYKNLNCCLFRSDEEDEIEFGWSPKNIYYFSGKEDFIANAKIDNEYVRDIWDKVEDPRYM